MWYGIKVKLTVLIGLLSSQCISWCCHTRPLWTLQRLKLVTCATADTGYQTIAHLSGSKAAHSAWLLSPFFISHLRLSWKRWTSIDPSPVPLLVWLYLRWTVKVTLTKSRQLLRCYWFRDSYWFVILPLYFALNNFDFHSAPFLNLRMYF